jgi:hypothetical protein
MKKPAAFSGFKYKGACLLRQGRRHYVYLPAIGVPRLKGLEIKAETLAFKQQFVLDFNVEDGWIPCR